MTDHFNRWGAGISYGPVLSQTDLYLLNAKLELNPILSGKNPKFHLVFNLATGSVTGFSIDARDRDLPFSQKDEPATIPRVSQLIIICEISPWCTIVRNDRGVTLGDVCTTIWRDYSDNVVTDAEFTSLPQRLQDTIRRSAAMHQQPSSAQWGMYYSPAAAPTRYRRFDWLRDRTFMELLKRDDNYAEQRLGFSAPNIFIMEMVA